MGRIRLMNKQQSKIAARQSELARKRRAMFLRLHLKGASGTELARRFGMSASRMNLLLKKAREEMQDSDLSGD